MRRMGRLELDAQRTVSAPSGRRPSAYHPWVEVTAHVRVAVPDWDLDEPAWVHWAVPVVEGRADPSRAFAFDPGRRAATPGAPPSGARRPEATVGREEAERLCEALLAAWRSRLRKRPVGEPRQATGGRGTGGAPSGQASESQGGEGRLEVETWRVRVAWYPEGVEPRPASDRGGVGPSRETAS